MLREWDQKFPGRIDNMHRAFSHVVPSHLMDRKLFPFETIRPTGKADPDGDKALTMTMMRTTTPARRRPPAEAGLPAEAAISLEALRRTLPSAWPRLSQD